MVPETFPPECDIIAPGRQKYEVGNILGGSLSQKISTLPSMVTQSPKANEVDVDDTTEHDAGVLQEYLPLEASPIFKGTTKFQPSSTMKNILITGGSGFMCVFLTTAKGLLAD